MYTAMAEVMLCRSRYLDLVLLYFILDLVLATYVRMIRALEKYKYSILKIVLVFFYYINYYYYYYYFFKSFSFSF